MLVLVYFLLPDQVFSFEFSRCQCVLFEIRQLTLAARELVFLPLKLYLAFDQCRYWVLGLYKKKKKKEQFETYMTLCQQIGIATHSFKLSFSSFHFIDKDLASEEVKN